MSEDDRGAPDGANGTQAPDDVARRGKLTEIRLAAGFLTILPVLPRAGVATRSARGIVRTVSARRVCARRDAGGRESAADAAIRRCARGSCAGTHAHRADGAVHLDAFADTADALGAGSDRRRALEIMRDSRIGSFGTAAIFFFLALEIVALATMGEARRPRRCGLRRAWRVGRWWRLDGVSNTCAPRARERCWWDPVAIAISRWPARSPRSPRCPYSRGACCRLMPWPRRLRPLCARRTGDGSAA